MNTPRTDAATSPANVFMHNPSVSADFARTLERESATLHDQLGEANALFDKHTKAVEEFLNELYALSVDPLADGKIAVSEMRKALLEAAIRNRDLRAQIARLEQREGELVGALNEAEAETAETQNESLGYREKYQRMLRVCEMEEDRNMLSDESFFHKWGVNVCMIPEYRRAALSSVAKEGEK